MVYLLAFFLVILQSIAVRGICVDVTIPPENHVG